MQQLQRAEIYWMTQILKLNMKKATQQSQEQAIDPLPLHHKDMHDASMLKRMRSHPVQDGVRKSQVDTVDVAIATATIQSPPTTPRQGAQGSRSVTSRRNVQISHLLLLHSCLLITHRQCFLLQVFKVMETVQQLIQWQPSMQQLPWMMHPL